MTNSQTEAIEFAINQLKHIADNTKEEWTHVNAIRAKDELENALEEIDD